MWDEQTSPFLILAPMEGVTDLVFRQVILKAGRPDIFFTEFTNVSSFASEKGRSNALSRLKIAPNENPIVAQIWGKNPDHFKEIAGNLKTLGFDGLDINMGCPDKNVNKAGGGAAMIKTPDLAVECIKSVKAATSLPISVKTRLGFTCLDEYQTWLPILLKQNLAALTVHLRTRKEMSKVKAHFELIPEIVKLRDEIAPSTKLIINGDIKNRKMAMILKSQYPGVDGFMIGRGVFENPYCFTDYEPTTKDLKNLFLYHLDLFDRESRMPFETLKHFFKVYFHGQPGSAELRNKLMAGKNTAELREILAQNS